MPKIKYINMSFLPLKISADMLRILTSRDSPENKKPLGLHLPRGLGGRLKMKLFIA